MLLDAATPPSTACSAQPRGVHLSLSLRRKYVLSRCALVFLGGVHLNAQPRAPMLHVFTIPHPRRTRTDRREGKDSNNSQKSALGPRNSHFECRSREFCCKILFTHIPSLPCVVWRRVLHNRLRSPPSSCLFPTFPRRPMPSAPAPQSQGLPCSHSFGSICFVKGHGIFCGL